MCGVIVLFGRKIYINCEIPNWSFKPPFDFSQIAVHRPTPGGPPPTPWREELTFLGTVLAGTTLLQDRELAKELGSTVADIGNKVARQAGVEVAFHWDAHAGGEAALLETPAQGT